MRPTFPRALIVAVTALACFGCSSKHHVTRPPASARPAPDSPVNAVRLFEWGWNHRDLDAIRDVLAGDFRFVFALGDSAGNTYRDHPFDRETMLTCLEHLFIGGGFEPPANSIVLTFDPTLRPQTDMRLGKDLKWHKEILTGVDLSIRTDQQEYRVMGNARFYVVRGDSALVPADIGAVPDTARWYISEIDDGTLLNPDGSVARRARPARVLPAHNDTWGAILALYR